MIKANRIPILVGTKMMLSSVIAFLIYTSFDLKQGFWSVVTIAAITQADFSKTFLRASMRSIGTLLGATFGFFFALFAHGDPLIILILFFIFITITSYLAIQTEHATYGYIVAGLTMVIVLSSSIVSGELISTAVYRTLEVFIGIFVLLIVNYTIVALYKSQLRIPNSLKADLALIPSEFKKISFKKNHLNIAIKIALACLITFCVWVYFRQPQGFWATITCMLIMEESLHATRTNSMIRFWAHVLAAIVGALCALFLGANFLWRVFPLAISFFICGYFIGLKNKYSNLGNTTAAALAIMLLMYPGPSSTLTVIAARFLNVMFGIAVGIFITHFFWSKNTSPT